MGVDWEKCDICKICYNDHGQNYPRTVEIDAESKIICPDCWREQIQHTVAPYCNWDQILIRVETKDILHYVCVLGPNILSKLSTVARKIDVQNILHISWVHIDQHSKIPRIQSKDNFHTYFSRIYQILHSKIIEEIVDCVFIKKWKFLDKYNCEMFQILSRPENKDESEDEKENDDEVNMTFDVAKSFYHGSVSKLQDLVKNVKSKFQTMVKKDSEWYEYHYTTIKTTAYVSFTVEQLERRLDNIPAQIKTLTKYAHHSKVSNTILQNVSDHGQGTFINVCIPIIFGYLHKITMFSNPRYLQETRQDMAKFISNKRKLLEITNETDAEPQLKRAKLF